MSNLIQEVISDLTRQRDAINGALASLEGANAPTQEVVTSKPKRGRPKLSPAARARISEAMKQRWAKVHATAKRKSFLLKKAA